MRNLLSAVIMAALFFSASAANAAVTTLGGTKIVVSAVASEKSFTLFVDEVGPSTVEVKLEAVDGTNLLTETVKGGKSFSKKYVLSNLPEGTYFLTLTKGAVSTIQTLEVTEKAVIVDKDEVKKFAPVFSLKGTDKLDVNALLNNVSKVAVSFLDNDSNVVFEKTFGDALAFHERFDIAKLAPGAYTVEVKAGTDTYFYSFTK